MNRRLKKYVFVFLKTVTENSHTTGFTNTVSFSLLINYLD